MIYKTNYFQKELRQAYTGNRISTKRKVTFALFTALISFALFFIFQLLHESVFSETFPIIMQESYFSTIYIYIHMALVMNTLYFILYYDTLFFQEIKRNSWYLLTKMGYNLTGMIFSKLTAIILSTVFVYTIGFFFTIFLTYFLKYFMVAAYFPTLYLAGLIDIVVIVTISMTLSLFIKMTSDARYSILFTCILLLVIKTKLGFYNFLSNRVATQKIINLFDFSRSLYIPVVFGILLMCFFIYSLKARKISGYYSLSHDNYESVLPKDVSVVLVKTTLFDFRTGRKKTPEGATRPVYRRKIIDAAVTTFLVLFIASALVFNVMVILISASTPGKEVAIHGIIPYIFRSTTMQPDIMMNDLAYFEKVEGNRQIEVGQIVLFEQNNISYVERVKSIKEGIYEVDIDHYPTMSLPGAMIKNIESDVINGVYVGRNRWLGVLILFSNTIIGRLVFLLIPSILLFYYKPITEKIAKIK